MDELMIMIRVLPGNFDTENIEDIVDYTKKIKHALKREIKNSIRISKIAH